MCDKVCVTVCVRERENARVCARERECVCVFVSVCERERKCVCVCVCGGEREKKSVCERERTLCVRRRARVKGKLCVTISKRERESICVSVCVRVRDREREREREKVCVRERTPCMRRRASVKGSCERVEVRPCHVCEDQTVSFKPADLYHSCAGFW